MSALLGLNTPKRRKPNWYMARLRFSDIVRIGVVVELNLGDELVEAEEKVGGWG